MQFWEVIGKKIINCKSNFLTVNGYIIYYTTVSEFQTYWTPCKNNCRSVITIICCTYKQTFKCYFLIVDKQLKNRVEFLCIEFICVDMQRQWLYTFLVGTEKYNKPEKTAYNGLSKKNFIES